MLQPQAHPKQGDCCGHPTAPALPSCDAKEAPVPGGHHQQGSQLAVLPPKALFPDPRSSGQRISQSAYSRFLLKISRFCGCPFFPGLLGQLSLLWCHWQPSCWLQWPFGSDSFKMDDTSVFRMATLKTEIDFLRSWRMLKEGRFKLDIRKMSYNEGGEAPA